jgi:hypothetical protein
MPLANRAGVTAVITILCPQCGQGRRKVGRRDDAMFRFCMEHPHFRHIPSPLRLFLALFTKVSTNICAAHKICASQHHTSVTVRKSDADSKMQTKVGALRGRRIWKAERLRIGARAGVGYAKPNGGRPSRSRATDSQMAVSGKSDAGRRRICKGVGKSERGVEPSSGGWLWHANASRIRERGWLAAGRRSGRGFVAEAIGKD